MTSMLLSVSMVVRSPAAGPRGVAGAGRAGPALLLTRFFDVLGDDVLVGGVPVGHLLELAALHLPDLYEPTALVVGGGDLERWHQPAQREVVDLLEALLGVLAGDLAVGLGLHGVAN